MSNRQWSAEQLPILEYFKSGTGNLMVEARAGTGKTTTIQAGIALAPEPSGILYAVFGNRNKKEAEEKINDPRCQVRTLHSLGYGYIRRMWANAKPDDSVEMDRIKAVAKGIPDPVASQVRKAVGYTKNTSLKPKIDQIIETIETRGFDCPDYEDRGWTVGRLAAVVKDVVERAKVKDLEGRISFDDMVYLPVAMGWVRPYYNLSICDESQDMSLPQLVMLRRSCKKGGRIVIIGDSRQAIFGFRGAATNGMEMMRKDLDAKVLPLTTTYRCPTTIVDMAKVLVPDYQAHASAPTGEIKNLSINKLISTAAIGDVVLSRTNAPLMSCCLSFLRAGISARIEGRDIGKMLVSIATGFKARSVPDFLEKISAWAERQIARATKHKAADERISAIQDQADTLVAVAGDCKNVPDIIDKIGRLFQDSDDPKAKPTIVHSSIHRAKGMEWKRVFLLVKTLQVKPNQPAPPSESSNLTYVAVTRCKEELVLVDG